MALVITLSAVVLVTALILAFFSRAQLNRQTSYSSVNITKADFLARAALDIVAGEIRDEISDATRSTIATASGIAVYQPSTPASRLPASLGVSGATGPLLKVSAADVPIRPDGTIRASSLSIASPSLNGRSLSASRWFTSASSSPMLGSQGTLPTWLFVTRGNGVKAPEIEGAKDPEGDDYVIGRFAYTVYDVGSLLDATVAGYAALAAADAAFKASPAYADLTALGVPSSANSDLVAWRNASTAADADTFAEWASGLPRRTGTANAAALAAAHSGHRSIVSGDNTFLSRHDLLRYAQYQNTALAPGLPYLTHFSRALNAPSYAPPAAAVSAVNPSLATLAFPSAATLTHYRDDGTAEPSAQVSAGSPLLQRRFSLAKLAWITSAGPSAASSAFSSTLSDGQKAAAIRACFGLQWTTTSIGGVATPCWNYVGSVAGGPVPTAIETLATVAAEGREPNFFECLKAGILDGSIGKPALNKTITYTDQQTRDASKDLQIFRIGANIVDCAGADNFPTTFTLLSGGVTVPVHGVKDLPYFFGLGCSRLTTASNPTPTTQTMTSCSLVMDPVLFNPHQASTASGGGPAAIRVRIVSGTVQSVYTTYGTDAGRPLVRLGLSGNPASNLAVLNVPIQVPSTSFEDFRGAATRILGASGSPASTQLATVAAPNAVWSGGSQDRFHGFLYYAYTGLPETYSTTVTTGITSVVNNLLVVLEYRDPVDPTVWHIYDTIAGNEAFSGTGTGISGDNAPTGVHQTLTFGLSVRDVNTVVNYLTYVMFKLDPRTTRFGLGLSTAYIAATTVPLPGATGPPNGIVNLAPFGSGNVAGTGTYPGLWAEGGTVDWADANGSAISNVADPDTHVRIADAGLSGATANLFRSMTDATRRPVILHRLYRSVAELGYVFRDSPWKTLNFFDPDSGDNALLDLFSVSDEPALAAGRPSLNATQSRVQQALFSGTAQAFDGTGLLANPAALASAYNGYAFSSGAPSATMPASLGRLVDFMATGVLAIGGTLGLDGVKAHREAVVRSLASTTQTRTWNLLLDVVAQTGHYPGTARNLGNFIVEGERRYWLSLAVDRYTGAIVDQQLEPDPN